MDKIRGIGDILKKKKEDKKFFIKLAIGVGVVVLLLIVIIVVAVVVPKSDSEEKKAPATNANSGSESSTTTTTEKPPQRKVYIPDQYYINIGPEASSVGVVLAVDDVKQNYVVLNDEEGKSVYVILNFKERTQTFMIVRKDSDEFRKTMKEVQVLFCDESRMEQSFTGQFLTASELESKGKTQFAAVNSQNVTIRVRKIVGPFEVFPHIATVINQSCKALSGDVSFKWPIETSKCVRNTSLDTNMSCPRDRCPKFEEVPKTSNQACKKFKACNLLMGKCDKFWSQIAYDGRPYCACRKNLVHDADGISCPPAIDDQGECEEPRLQIVNFETINPCYCRYGVQRVHPYRLPVRGTSTVDTRWRIDAVHVTGPAKNFKECPCRG